MRWDRRHESPDVVDARGRKAGPAPGGLFALLGLAMRFGWKGILLAAVVVGAVLLFSGDRLGGLGPTPEPLSPAEDEQLHFVSFVLDDVQQTWAREVDGYQRAVLVVFRGATPTACGYGSSATGPFYCPRNGRVYLDLSFFDELARRFGAPGDFAQAYVIAHEIGHHLQNQLGTMDQIRGGVAGRGADADSVRLELQADCFAGVWAASAEARGLLEIGDLEEGLRAAAAIGDDRLQLQSQGTVTPDSFTHGTGAQRVRWLRRGYETGEPGACDTFGVRQL